jgi:hypothetical protein
MNAPGEATLVSPLVDDYDDEEALLSILAMHHDILNSFALFAIVLRSDKGFESHSGFKATFPTNKIPNMLNGIYSPNKIKQNVRMSREVGVVILLFVHSFIH